MSTDVTCIGCGCSESDPCEGGCYWITGIVEGVSVCSTDACIQHLPRFLAADLEICPQFRDECPPLPERGRVELRA